MAIQQTFDFFEVAREAPVAAQSPVRWPSRLATTPPIQTDSRSTRPDGATDRDALLRQLRAKVGCISTAPTDDGAPLLSTGCQAIDAMLPRGGLRLDAINEWIAETEGCGAGALALIAAATLLRSHRGPLVVVGKAAQFYPPAAIALGIRPERLIWVRPSRHADAVWAIDQALRCPAVAAVWAPLAANLDDRDARRFQLAAETGRTAGLFVRPAATRGRPSFADVRLHVRMQTAAEGSERVRSFAVSPSLPLLKVTVDRCRGSHAGRAAWVQIDDQARIISVTSPQIDVGKHETAAVRLASQLAHPKTAAVAAKRRRA